MLRWTLLLALLAMALLSCPKKSAPPALVFDNSPTNGIYSASAYTSVASRQSEIVRCGHDPRDWTKVHDCKMMPGHNLDELVTVISELFAEQQNMCRP